MKNEKNDQNQNLYSDPCAVIDQLLDKLDQLEKLIVVCDRQERVIDAQNKLIDALKKKGDLLEEQVAILKEIIDKMGGSDFITLELDIKEEN